MDIKAFVQDIQVSVTIAEKMFAEKLEENSFAYDLGYNGSINHEEYKKLYELLLEIKEFYYGKRHIDKRIMLNLYDIEQLLLKKTNVDNLPEKYDPLVDMWCEVDDIITNIFNS